MKPGRSTLHLGLVVAAAVAVGLLPWAGVPRSWLVYLFHFSIFLAMASMWNLLAGYAGLVSLCQPAFLGLAGYAMTIGTWIGVPWWVGVPVGAIVAGVFALLISGAVFRLSGVYFAIGTLVVPEALRMVFYLWRPVGGAMHGAGAGYMVKGIGGVSANVIYELGVVVGVAALAIVGCILRSKWGLALAAIRDNERAAASAGVNVFRVKLLTFIVAAAVTGAAGAVYYLNQGYIEPSATFSVKWTMVLLLATVIGGVRSEEGPVIGTAVFVFLYFALARYSGYSLLIQGIILIVIMLLAPGGIADLVRRCREHRFLPGRGRT